MTNIIKLVRMANEFHEEYAIKKDKAMIDISSDTIGNFPTVHLRVEAFEETFGADYQTKARNCDTYFFEHFAFHEGVKFFCVSRGGLL